MAPVQNKMFQQQLDIESKRVLVYERVDLQLKARACVPLDQLMQKAREQSTCELELRDMLLVELLNWFKQDFFSWFNTAHCNACNVAMIHNGLENPTREDLFFGAERVESYKCAACGKTDRFPRYNDPGKLLETRKGRCGEWANCFTLICRSLNYDARYILDWTDHVWTEVYSEKQKRWLHCDSCEAACDKPLLYEAGWGKKLTYVIAFSKDEVQDVSWRYSADHKETLQRRVLVPEAWIIKQTSILSRKLQANLTDPQRYNLAERLVRELAEFLLPAKAKCGELQGRISGDVGWRKSRGELGQSGHNPVVWIPTETELECGEFCLEYSTSLDQYVRRSDNDSVTRKWSDGVFECESVFRKVETDWKMAYIARTEGTTAKGKIAWKFDLSSLGNLMILQVCVSCPGTTYEDGVVRWKICGPDKCQILPNGCVDYEVDLTGSKWCILSVELERGKGNVAWQHAQIARQSTADKDQFPFSFRVLFGSTD